MIGQKDPGSHAWWHISVAIPVFRRLRQKDHESQTSLDFKIKFKNPEI
jgi:hypothetical protein